MKDAFLVCFVVVLQTWTVYIHFLVCSAKKCFAFVSFVQVCSMSASGSLA